MIKECVVLNGKIINIGPWDYQKTMFEVSPAKYDEDGNIIKEAVIEEQTINPLPKGAVIEERDFECDTERGWYEVGTPVAPTKEERLEALEMAILAMLDL